MGHTITNASQSNIYLHFRLTVFLALAVLFGFSAWTQPCIVPIQNNSFTIETAVCTNTVALLQGSVPTGGNGTYTYQWESTSSNSCADNSFVPIAGATQKDYSVPSSASQQLCYRRVVTSGSCSSVSNKTKVQGGDRTTPSPPTVIALSPTCLTGGIITIIAPQPAPGISYSINGTDYSNTSGIFIALTAGSYSVTARLLSGCVSPSRTVNLSAAAAPTGSITPANASICAGQSQVLTVTGGTSYRWYRNNILIAGASSNTYTASQAGTYKADIINGICTGTSTNTATITMLPSPVGTITPASANLCAGDSINLSVSGGNGYQWYRDNVIIIGAVSSTYKVKQGGTYKVEITGSNGCKAEATNSVVVTPLNAPAGTITPAVATVCTGGTVTLTSNGGTSYRWYKDNVIIPGATTATYIATQAGTYKTEITNAAGCKAFSSNAVVSPGTSPTGTIAPASGQLCGSNASLTLTVTGGNSYQWYRNGVVISGATTATYVATTTGTYTAQISNGNCTGLATNSVVISQGTAPTGSISPAEATICPGSSQLLSVSGGISYQWMRNGVDIVGATSSTYLASQAGTYSVRIISGGCSGNASNAAIVTAGTAPVGIITPATAAICTGSSQLLTATGGVAYQWFKDNVLIPGATAATYTATQQGSYSVDVTNSDGCKARAANPSVVTLLPVPSGSISPASGQLCDNGSLTLSVSGGATYQWFKNGIAITGATGSTYVVTSAGSYTANIIAASCVGQSANSVTVTQASSPTGSISPASANVCPGASQLLTASGATGFQWFKNSVIIPGATSSTYLATTPGVYSVLLNNGICSAPASNSTTITEYTLPQGTITPASAAICNNGSQVLTAAGGSSYQWFKNGVVINGATAATYLATSAGVFSVEVTSSNGCKAPALNNAVVTITTAPTSSISPASGTLCTNGSLVLTATGGISYRWYRNGVLISGAIASTLTITQAGTYTADVINNGGCNAPATNASIITQGAAPTGSINPSTAIICGAQNVILTVGGGTSYQWFLNGNAIAGATASTYTASSPGTYSVTIFSGTCSGPASNVATVSMGAAPNGTITPANAAICTGSSQVLIATGGVAYQWFKDNILIPGATASTYTATQQGSYSVDITNNDGCKARASNNAIVTITTAPTGAISPASGTLCTNGSLVLTATGGISYRWYRNGVLISGATASTLTITQAGTYTADVINNGGCNAPATNAATIIQGAAPIGSINPSTAIICGAQNVILTVGGGTSYQWFLNGNAIAGATASTYAATLPGSYSVTIFSGTCSGPASNVATVSVGAAPNGTITPANAAICTGSSQVLIATGGVAYQWFKDNILIPGATASTYTATQQGSYSVDITNNDGCKARASNNAIVTITTAPTGAISPASGTLCTNGSLVLTATGGISYRWYRNGVLISGATASTLTITQAGTYTADVINNGGCNAPATNAATIIQGAAPIGSINPSTAIICGAQNVILTVGGGTSYQWFLNGNAIAGATASTYTAASPGTYSVTIFSGTCSGPAANTAIVSAATPISFSVNTVQPTCSLPQGSITISNASGGSSGYLYSINNGSSFQTANTFANLTAGSYFLVVKDASDCRSTPQLVIITAPSNTLQASFTTTDITCTQPTGTVTVSATGGTAPYQYSLNGGPAQATNSFANITAGLHRVLITDAAGCTLEIPFAIQAMNSTLLATVTTTNPACGQQTGSVQVAATGGTPGYTYSLDNGAYQASNSFTNLPTGTHNVKVKDAAGCITQVNFQIDATGTLPILIITVPPSICVGATANLQNASITAGSDTALTLTYWNDSAATSPVTNPAVVVAGKYFIKAINRAGCFTIKPVTVSTSITTGSISVQGPATPCRGQVVTLRASNGRSYQWYKDNNLIAGAVSNTYTVTTDGRYSVLIDDGNCSAFARDTIQIQYKDCPTLQDPKVFVPTAFSPNNNNANDVLRPILYKIRELRFFRVYNRWGQLVFQTSEISKGWDGNLNGKPQPTDTFSWMLECVDVNGNIIKDSGRSILIR